MCNRVNPPRGPKVRRASKTRLRALIPDWNLAAAAETTPRAAEVADPDLFAESPPPSGAQIATRTRVRSVLAFALGLTGAYAVSSWRCLSAPLSSRTPAQPGSPGRRAPALQPEFERSRPTDLRSRRRPHPLREPVRLPSSVAGPNLGGARPGFRCCPDRPIPTRLPRHPLYPGSRKRSRPGVPPPPAPSLQKRPSCRRRRRHRSPWVQVPGCCRLWGFACGFARLCFLRGPRGPRGSASEAPR